MRSGVLARRVSILTLALAQLVQVGPARADVTINVSRTEALYSQEADPDCSALSQKQDAELPYNVVRLRATVNGVPADQVRYRWSIPKPNMGTLAADLDLGPSDQTAAIRGMCSEFGNSCVLTADKLPLYNQATVLWLAPTCAVLPERTTTNYPGRQVRIRVEAFVGRRKLGKSAVVVGFGRTANMTLFVDGEDGFGKPFGVPSDIRPFLSASIDTKRNVMPVLDTVEFADGAGDTTAPTPMQPCSLGGKPFDACANSLLYHSAGKFLAVATAKYDDGSALCDNLTVRVLSANIIPKLSVSVTPRRASYVPGDARKGTANLRVTLKNASPRAAGANILLAGSGVLTCSADLKVGGTTETNTTTFDLQHCSGTADQPCTTTSQCRPPFCPTCTADEICLVGSHCSVSFTQPCNSSIDCEAPRCPTCEDGEVCTMVLATPQIIIPVGKSVDLINKTVSVANTLPNPARIKETYTVTTFNAGSDEAELSYRILGRPGGSVGGAKH